MPHRAVNRKASAIALHTFYQRQTHKLSRGAHKGNGEFTFEFNELFRNKAVAGFAQHFRIQFFHIAKHKSSISIVAKASLFEHQALRKAPRGLLELSSC